MNPTRFNFALSVAVRVALLLAGCVQGLSSFAQVNVTMPFNSGATTFTIAPPATCSFNFFDDAGPGGVYSNLSNPATSVVTFAPSIPGNKVRVVFTSFGVEDFFDALFVYDGASAMAPQISSGNPAGFVSKAGGFWGITPPNNIASNAVQATAGNASGALTFQFESDATPIPNTFPGWEAVVAELTPGVCTLQNLSSLTVNVPSNGCTADVLAPLPGYSPGGCNLNLAIRYRINGGPATSVMGFPANVLIPDLPAGANIVTWELINPCGGAVISVVNQTITVQDKTLPVLSCPSSVTLNLDPGECGEQYLYGAVTATDNCQFMSPEVVVNHPDLTNVNNFFAGITFDVRNTGADPVYITGFTAPIAPGPHTVQLWLAAASNSAVPVMNNPLAWSLIGQVNVLSTAVGFFDLTDIPIGVVVLQPGETKGFYLATTDGSFMRYTNGNAVSSDGRVSIISNGHGAGAYPFSNTSAPRTFVGAVKYTVPVAGGTVSQIAGLPSGAEFPIGTTTNIFRAFDKAGNSATCSFTVTVNEYSGPSGSIVCNDVIHVSLDEFCTAKLGADDVLEGGNFGCYDKYPVEVDKTPTGYGPWVPAVFDASDVGKMYPIRVRNPANGLMCDQSKVIIFDFLPPDLECSTTPIDIPGNLPPSPIDTKAVDITYAFLPSGLPKTVMDFQTIEIEIPVGAPPDMTINDVDFRLRITGDPFNLNLNAVLESPSGTIVTLYDQFTGCAPSPLFARFDDEGVNSIACADLTTNKNVRIPASIGQQLSAFDGEPVAGVWKLRVTDLDAFADQSTIVIAELIVNTAYKYTAGFPNGLTWPNPKITQVNNNTFVVKAPLIDACSDVTLSYVDQSMPGTCQSGFLSIITRTWQAIDASGNTATCVETIRLLRADFDDVVPPPNYDDIDEDAFACGGPYPSPDWIESQGLQGYPEVFGMSNGGGGINWTYSDDLIQTLCDGTYTIKRTWLLDIACSGVVELEQIIRVVDEKGPEIDTPADMEVSTGSANCCAIVPLPSTMVFDSCSRINNIQARVEVNDIQTGLPVNTFTYAGSLTNFPGNNPAGINDTLAVFGNTACLPVGKHTVYYIAQDACGNTSSVSFTVTVVDYSPPSAACDEFTVVSLGWDDPNDCYLPDSLGCQFAGVTWVNASVFDDGSTDNCSNIRFRVRRQVPYSSCITGLDKSPCPGLPGGVSEFTLATQESDSIKFYCCEVGTTQKVILRVYQLEPDGSYSLEPDGTPIYNECEVEVTVQDKIKPSCQAPPNATVSCENFDPSLWAYGLPKVEDNCCLDSTLSHMGIKGLEHEVDYSSFDTVCSRGTIRRLFTVSDCQGQTRNCSQQIVVNYDQDYFIKFPDDVLVSFCDSSGVYGEPQFFGEDCELLAVSYEDQLYTVVPDVCFKIERTWTVTNWCSYNPNGQCISVPNPNPNNTLNHPNNLPGPIVSAPGTTGPWAPTVVKINPTDQVTTNYSTFWNPNANCYKYKQIIKVVDGFAPVIDNCPQDTVPYCDISENDPQLWNQSHWYDAVHQSHNLCEAPVDLTITAGDACSKSNINIRYLLFLDLDGNGSMESVVSSTTPPPAGSVRYNNANTPNYSGGIVRQFDGRAVPASGLYQFALEQTVSGDKLVAGVRWNIPGSLNTYSVPQLPHGTHKIKWFVSDGCGNETVCEYTFTVKDCKVPSVVCINGLSTNVVLPMGAMIGVQDLAEYGIDNCTPANQLTFSMRKEGTGTGFPLDSLGNPVEMLFYFCNELGPNPIEIWAMDKAGNASFCKTYLLVQDNPGTNGTVCNPGTSASVAGFLGTELDFGLEEGHVQISGQNPAGPTFDLHEMTDQNGVYQFNNAIPLFSNYSVIPSKDDNPLNGVSTYDLVLISRHILGLEPLSSPYKMIAADANKSGSITTFDVVELRKLILGIYTQLPANTSWRFVDADFDFPSANNPFQSVFPESKSLGSIQQSMMDDDFVAIKIGDVNGNAIANTFMQAEERSAGRLFIDAADQPLEKDETVTVWFKPASPVEAYQMTMQFQGLEVLEVLPGDGMDESNFAVFEPRPELGESAALTTSINGTQASFGIRFRALRKGQLSQMLLASSRITRSEAYSESGEALDVALRFLNDQEAVISGVGFELYQNQPNPFVNKTMIGFHLPEAGEAILRVFDETGRLLHMERSDFAKGYGTFMVDKSMLSGDGVYFYQVESVDAFASRKMIQTN